MSNDASRVRSPVTIISFCRPLLTKMAPSARRPRSTITSCLDSEVAMLDILACGRLGRGPGPHHAALFQHIVYVRRAAQCAHVLVDQQNRQSLGLQPLDRAVDLRPY